jgi:hypothetical protein
LLFLSIIAWRLEAVGGQLSLSWLTTSIDELGFSIERSTGPTGTFAEIARTAAGVTTYTDPNADDTTTNCYRVRAFNDTEYSDYSNAACATTAPTTVGLAVVKIGPGSGTVTSVPAGLICGSNCSGSYPRGTTITLAAAPEAGSTFAGWSGGGCSGTEPCTVTLTSGTTVMPTFELGPGGLSLGLSLSRHTASPGDTVQVSITAGNSGEAVSAELYVIMLVPPAVSPLLGCPDGDGVVFFASGFSKLLTPCVNTSSAASFEPLYQDMSFPAATPATAISTPFSFTWPVGIPGGTYTFVIFAVPPGTFANAGFSANVIAALASDSLDASP